MVSMREASPQPGHSLLGFWRFDPASHLVHADEKVCQAFGLPPEGGREGTRLERFVDRVHPDDQEPFAAALRQAAETGTTFAHSYRILEDHPAARTVFALGRAFHDGEGAARYYVGALFEAGPTRSQGGARIDMVNHLIAALDIARGLDEDILARLIEAVLLEAGRRLAATVGRMPDGVA